MVTVRTQPCSQVPLANEPPVGLTPRVVLVRVVVVGGVLQNGKIHFGSSKFERVSERVASCKKVPGE